MSGVRLDADPRRHRPSHPRCGPARRQLAEQAGAGVVIVSDRETLAEAVFEPQNVLGAALVVAIAGKASGFDMARAAQNMMLAAWDEGVVSSPNGQRDPAAVERLVGAPVGAVLTFGYPAKPRDPESRSAEEWSARANRKSLEEVVRRSRGACRSAAARPALRTPASHRRGT